MSIKIKSASDIAKKYAEVTPQRSVQYKEGIEDTSPSEFEDAAIAGEENFGRAMADVIAEGRRASGLEGSGKKWQDHASDLGPSRFTTGTAGAADEYQAGFAPYREVIADLDLPPRGPTGDPRNIERVRVIADALRKKKVSG